MEHMAKVIMAGESLVGNTGLLGYLGQYNGTWSDSLLGVPTVSL